LGNLDRSPFPIMGFTRNEDHLIDRLLDDTRVIAIGIVLAMLFAWVIDRLTNSVIVFPLIVTLLSPALLVMGFYAARRLMRRVTHRANVLEITGTMAKAIDRPNEWLPVDQTMRETSAGLDCVRGETGVDHSRHSNRA